MNKNNSLTIILSILLVAAIGYIVFQNKVVKTIATNTPIPQTTSRQPAKEINVTTPLNVPIFGDAVISGVARRVYFEASFPVKLLDMSNTIVWQGPATAIGDWMTVDYVPFSVTLPTATLNNGNYTLVLTQDDASGELVPPELYSISLPLSIAN